MKKLMTETQKEYSKGGDKTEVWDAIQKEVHNKGGVHFPQS